MFIRPDWKNAGAYLAIEKAPLVQIAWEFLRRNPAYHAAWSKYAQHVRELAAGDVKVARYAELVLTANPSSEMFDAIGDHDELNALEGKLHLTLLVATIAIGDHDELNALEGRLDFEFGVFADVPGMHRQKAPLYLQYGRAWGLDRIAHPMQSYSFMEPRFVRVGTTVTSLEGHGPKELMAPIDTARLFDPKWLTLQIDLSLPLEVIESSVLEFIKRQRANRIKRGSIEPVKSRALAKARYAEYLRILDGAAAGFSVTEIGETLFPHAENAAPDRPRDKRFRAALSKAIRLQTDGYRTLPLLQKTTVRKKI